MSRLAILAIILAMRNGHFWADHFQRSLIPQVDAYVSALHERLLPAFKNLEGEAGEFERRMMDEFERATAGDEYVDPASAWERAQEMAGSHWVMMDGLRQGLVNLWAAGLFHLLEHQALLFINRELFPPGKTFSGYWPVAEMGNLLRSPINGYDTQSIDVDRFSSWAQIDQLRLLANCVKHPEGPSCTDLRERRPDLFTAPQSVASRLPLVHTEVDSPLMGEGLYVTPSKFDEYAEAVRLFWRELGSVIS